MQVVLQRVKEASVAVDGKTVSSIKRGLLLFVGIEKNDTIDIVGDAAGKIAKLRVFEDNAGKMNLSVADVNGGILVVPEFTLAASVDKGTRPSFDRACEPEGARKLCAAFTEFLRQDNLCVAEGVFGAKMNVSLINDGPVTFILSCEKKK